MSNLASEEGKSLLTTKIEELSINMEKMKLAEYVELLNQPKRLLFLNFIAGVARGLGIAVGFAVLGALAILVLRRLVVLNLPLIGDFIALVVKLVQTRL